MNYRNLSYLEANGNRTERTWYEGDENGKSSAEGAWTESDRGITFIATKSGKTRVFIPWHRVLAIIEYRNEGFTSA